MIAKSMFLLGLPVCMFLSPPAVEAQAATTAQNKAALETPNTFKEQQKQTMTSMKTIAVAWESYFNDFGTYCTSGKSSPELKWENISPKEVQALLVPLYIKNLPVQDGWGNPLQFAVQCLPKGGGSYAMRSSGSDKAWDAGAYASGSSSLKPEKDIVFTNGQFDQWPEGFAP